MTSVKTSAGRKVCQRVAVAAVLAVMAAGAGACGNRLNEGRLQAAARQNNGGGQPAPGAASPAAGASAENPAPGGATETTSVPAGNAATNPTAATAHSRFIIVSSSFHPLPLRERVVRERSERTG